MQYTSQSSKDFNNLIETIKLLDIPSNNGTYTWNNRRENFTYIEKKLDRFFLKGELRNTDRDLESTILPIAGSYHYPVRIELSEPKKPHWNPFKCKKMWFLDDNFMEHIKVWWKQGNF